MSDDNVIDIWGHDRFMSKQNGKLIKEEHTKYILEEDDGNVAPGDVNGFFLSVETDDKNQVGTLKRRFAVGKNAQGITLLKGEPSFSSNDQILIDELVFYIQQNDLKAT